MALRRRPAARVVETFRSQTGRGVPSTHSKRLKRRRKASRISKGRRP